jgi:hypothetical protein
MRDGRTFVYRYGSELPSLRLPWADAFGDPIDFSAGYTFTPELRYVMTQELAPTQPTITGGFGYVDVVWPTNSLDLPIGRYTLRVRAHETVSNKDRDFDPAHPLLIRVLS